MDLATRTQLRRRRLQLPAEAQPVATCEDRHGTHPLYLVTSATAIPYRRPPKDWSLLLTQRYPSPRAAYVAACEALFALNRFAKHANCSPARRQVIYALKDRWTKRLWDEGFCIGAILVRSPSEQTSCSHCLGNGDDENGYPCRWCAGYGHRIRGGRWYWFLRYAVDGSQFGWHQPEDLATWARPIGQEAPHAVVRCEKPVRLAQRRMSESLALLRWVLAAGVSAAPTRRLPAGSLKDYWTQAWSTGASLRKGEEVEAQTG